MDLDNKEAIIHGEYNFPDIFLPISLKSLLRGQLSSSIDAKDYGLITLIHILQRVGLNPTPVESFYKIGTAWDFSHIISFACELDLGISYRAEESNIKTIFHRMVRYNTMPYYFPGADPGSNLKNILPRGTKGILYEIKGYGFYFKSLKESPLIERRVLNPTYLIYSNWIRIVAHLYGRFINRPNIDHIDQNIIDSVNRFYLQ